MSENWYYVQNKNRQGPVEVEVIKSLIKDFQLTEDDYVWKKGFESWKKIKEVDELNLVNDEEILPPTIEEFRLRLETGDIDEKRFHILIGIDRGQKPTSYGPYSLRILQKLFQENRINGRTQVFYSGLGEYRLLADFEDFEKVFNEVPPEIEAKERRLSVRKPFIARLFVANNKKLYEGICRDISTGGMQILLDNFSAVPGDEISLNVHPENSEYHFTASGEVVRMLEGNSGFSFRFKNLTAEAKKAIENYIEHNY
jgi:hypothetical protein